MTNETAIGEERADGSRRGADPYRGIESALAELAQSPPSSAEAQALREQLILRCLPLAEHVARRYTGRGESYEDLFQVASQGVVQAIDRFDRKRGKPFLAFAAPTVLDEVRRQVRDRTWAARALRRNQEIQAMIRPTVESMTYRLGRVPSAMEIALQLDVELLEVTRALLTGDHYRVCSAETRAATAPVSSARGAESPGHELIMQKMVATRLLAELSDTERWVLYLRFFRGRSRSQIAAQLDVPQMQISWILSHALATIRESARRQ